MAAAGNVKTFLLFTILLTLAADAASGAVPGPIKTLVILVMENRSFDHMLGWMKRLNPRIDGVTGAEWNAVSAGDRASARVYFKDDAEYVDPNPGHSFEAIREQVFGSNRNASANPPPMNGFAQNAESLSANMSEEVMKGFRPEAIPVYATLAREFALFDRWFSSLPGPTQPNRLFVYSGTSHGTTSHDPRQLARGFPQKTIFESVRECGLSFGIYHHGIPATLFYRNLRRLKYVGHFHSYGGEFRRHARAGSLPNLVAIEPRYFNDPLGGSAANDDHPSHDVSEGQALVKEVYEALRAGPQWNHTLLLVTYDEHGGFYDHVPTPVANVPSPDGIAGPAPFFFRFDRLGVRVPSLMASPWIERGTVMRHPGTGPYPSSEFEHSSIPATVKKLFNLSSNFLTYRDAWAGTFEDVLRVRKAPRTDCPEVLPDPALRRGVAAAQGDAELSEFQNEMVQLAAVLKGESVLKSFPEEIGSRMKVKEAAEYVEDAVERFMEASRAAIQLGASETTIVDMRPSLTTRRGTNRPLRPFSKGG